MSIFLQLKREKTGVSGIRGFRALIPDTLQLTITPCIIEIKGFGLRQKMRICKVFLESSPIFSTFFNFFAIFKNVLKSVRN
jgi:hypothetical protein